MRGGDDNDAMEIGNTDLLLIVLKRLCHHATVTEDRLCVFVVSIVCIIIIDNPYLDASYSCISCNVHRIYH